MIDENIEKAEAAVIVEMAKYDATLDKLVKLVTKRKEMDDKKALEAYHAGRKATDETKVLIRAGED